MINLLRTMWIAVSIAVLIVTLNFYNSQTGNDADLFLIYGMLFLTFPLGFVVAVFFALLAYIETLTGISLVNIAYGKLTITIFWACFFAVGYLQWFKLIPYIATKIVRRKSS